MDQDHYRMSEQFAEQLNVYMTKYAEYIRSYYKTEGSIIPPERLEDQVKIDTVSFFQDGIAIWEEEFIPQGDWKNAIDKSDAI